MNTSFRQIGLPVCVGALGYFVDIYDLVLFSILRVQSLQSLGVPEDQWLSVGVELFNAQMFGMLVGGVAWGMLGDKRGRLSVLFGSILIYSTANILNSWVDSVPAYALLRFIAGFGLSGELGAAVTLVSEILPKEKRGYGTALVAGVGLSGAVVAGLTGDTLPWRTAYLVGGLMGLALLVLRLGVFESTLYQSVRTQSVRRGDLAMLVGNRERFWRFLSCIGIGIPVWCVVGILMTFAPEFGKALDIQGPVTAGRAILFCYAGVALGDLFSGAVSQYFRTRKKVVLVSLFALTALMAATLLSRGMTSQTFYTFALLLGLSTGYWAVFITIAAEHFGTNLRATVATSVPNFVRGTVVPITFSFQFLAKPLGLVPSAAVVCFLCVGLALFSLYSLDETHGRDLNYLEH